MSPWRRIAAALCASSRSIGAEKTWAGPPPDQASIPGPREQAGDPEPADPQPVGDVHLGDALEVVLPRDPGGQDNLGRAISRQAGHVALPCSSSGRSFEHPDLIFAAFLDFA